jgi:flagellar basal-body rod modification protein FlgD
MTAASTSPHEEITMAIQSTISQIQSAATTAQQATATKNDPSQLGESDFLKLLTTQLQQQDPTQPMDNTAMVAQLAQFSALEQMTNVNTTLTQMLTGQGTALEATAASMVGKTAIFNTDQVSLTQGKTATITANLSQAATNVTLTIQDGTGTTVRTIGEGACASGNNTFQWDGNDDKGNPLPTGTYTAQVLATDINGKSVSLTQNGSAPITGVIFSNGTPKFVAGGSTLQLSDISQLNE